MTGNTQGNKTEAMKLGDLVDWFVIDRGISIEFSFNEKRRGIIIPEYDIWYFQSGRRVTERCICMQMLTEFFSRNYRYSIAQIMSALNARAWAHYVNNFEPPEWLTAMTSTPIKEKRPPGRPRKYVRIAIPDPEDDDYEEVAVNT